MLHVEPTYKAPKPRNPVTVAAKQRAAGPHRKTAAGNRQLQNRLLKKVLTGLDEN